MALLQLAAREGAGECSAFAERCISLHPLHCWVLLCTHLYVRVHTSGHTHMFTLRALRWEHE